MRIFTDEETGVSYGLYLRKSGRVACDIVAPPGRVAKEIPLSNVPPRLVCMLIKLGNELSFTPPPSWPPHPSLRGSDLDGCSYCSELNS